MAIHRFQTPDGKVHRVEAPDRASAEAELGRALSRRTPGQEVMGALTTLNRSIPFADELADGVQAGVDIVAGRSKPGEAWRKARARSKGSSEDFEARRPIAANLTKGVGLVAQAVPVVKTAAPVATGLRGLLGTSARASAAGGLSAQVAGLGGEGTVSERQKAANDATLPAMAVGAAIPVAVAGAGAARRGVAKIADGTARTGARLGNRVSGGKLLDPRAEAAKRLGEALKADGLGPAEVRQALEEWQRTGASSPALVDLAGENTRALLRAAASKPGAARNAAVDYANQVTGDLQGNAIARTRALTGDRRPAAKVAAEIKDVRGRAAREMYPAFADNRVPVTDDVVSATDGAADWMRSASQLARAERRADVVAEIDALTNGGSLNDASAGTLDYMRRALRDRSAKAYQEGEGGLGAALKDRSKDLERVLTDVPGFDEARSTYRGYSRQLDALDEGRGVLNEVPDDFAATFDDLPADMGAVGGRQALEEAIGKPAEGATGTLNRIASSTNTGRNLETLYGEEVAGQYRDAIGREIDRVGNARFISPNTGSQTQLREADEALIDLPPTSKAGILKAIIDKARRGVTLTDEEREALLQLGTTIVRTGDDVPALPAPRQIERLMTPAQRQRLARMLAAGAGAQQGSAR